jgi:hypothetical protein
MKDSDEEKEVRAACGSEKYSIYIVSGASVSPCAPRRPLVKGSHRALTLTPGLKGWVNDVHCGRARTKGIGAVHISSWVAKACEPTSRYLGQISTASFPIH